jgi:hypothetical protein
MRRALTEPMRSRRFLSLPSSLRSSLQAESELVDIVPNFKDTNVMQFISVRRARGRKKQGTFEAP